ncbi:MAG: FKBP-type peptidyl-prolyl cis-trans isomerase [Bacteroidales bacterium]|nr:FKBP-type peptidyl-prolyl cis-trans isomerase [Bacteroidales bacterium]
MKKLIFAPVAALALAVGSSACTETTGADTWENYREWRESNNSWVLEQEGLLDENGDLFYTKIVPDWDKGSYVLMHWFNDRNETAGNLTPFVTSWISASYDLYLSTDVLVDTSEGLDDDVFTSQLSSLIKGWRIAMLEMHVGDTVQVVVPYLSGYGSVASGNVPPYSALRFNMRLKDIPGYEIRP